MKQIPIDTATEDYIGIDDFLRALGRQRKALGRSLLRAVRVVDECLMLFSSSDKGDQVFLLDLASSFALFQEDPATSLFIPDFEDAVPATWPVFAESEQPSIPLFYPIYPGELLYPTGSGLNIYFPGSSVPYQTVPFKNNITSEHGETINWGRVLVNADTDSGNYWFLSGYELVGYLNKYAIPTQSKQLIYSGGNLWEKNLTPVNQVFPLVLFYLPGTNYRRLKNTVNGDIQNQMVMIQQDDTVFSGQVYNIVEGVDGSGNPLLSSTLFGLSSLPNGARLPVYDTDGLLTNSTARHVDWMYDIFTSERSQFYYVVKFCSDCSILYNSAPAYTEYADDMAFYSGMSLAVEKRKKTDLSLVTTYNLTPSSVDQTLQGISTLAQIWNIANGDLSGSTTGLASIQSRFVPTGRGIVIVDAAGNEYPLMAVMEVTQDYFWDSVNGVASRDAYLANGTIAGTLCKNALQQTALLWLGGSDGFTWPDVDASGLSITETSGAMNDTPLGEMASWGQWIADSDHALIQMIPFPESGLTGMYEAGQSSNQRVISARVDTDKPIIRLEQVQNVSQPLAMFEL